MDLIQKIKDHIIEYRKDEDFKDDNDSKLIRIFFKQNSLNIPPNIQKLICEDHLFFEKIIKLYENKFIKYLSNGLSIIDSLEKLSHKIIVNSDNDSKKKYNYTFVFSSYMYIDLSHKYTFKF
jgi:hypothetical protein